MRKATARLLGHLFTLSLTVTVQKGTTFFYKNLQILRSGRVTLSTDGSYRSLEVNSCMSCHMIQNLFFRSACLNGR